MNRYGHLLMHWVRENPNRVFDKRSICADLGISEFEWPHIYNAIRSMRGHYLAYLDYIDHTKGADHFEEIYGVSPVWYDITTKMWSTERKR